MRTIITRRKFVTTGIAATGGVSGLGAAAVLAERYGLIPPDHGGIFGVGEALTYAAQRILTHKKCNSRFRATAFRSGSTLIRLRHSIPRSRSCEGIQRLGQDVGGRNLLPARERGFRAIPGDGHIQLAESTRPACEALAFTKPRFRSGTAFLARAPTARKVRD